MKRSIITLLVIFGLAEAGIFLTDNYFTENFSQAGFVHGANILLLMLTIATLWLQKKSLNVTNPHAFVRAVMGSMIIKMFVILGTLTAFLTLSGMQASKMAVFLALLIYFFYLIAEVYLALQMNKKKNA